VVLVGQRKALAIAIRNDRAAERFQAYTTDLSQAKLETVKFRGQIAVRFRRMVRHDIESTRLLGCAQRSETSCFFRFRAPHARDWVGDT
jgi:hypothetical protein